MRTSLIMFVSEVQRQKVEVILGYLLSAKHCIKGWEYNEEQNNVPVFINKCLWNSFLLKNPITTTESE